MNKLNIIILMLIILSSCNSGTKEKYFNEASQFEDRKKFKEAIEFHTKAIELDSGYLKAFLNRGADKSMLGDFKGAIDDYNTVLKQDPDNQMALLNRGKDKKRLHDFEGAVDDFNKLDSLLPAVRIAWNGDTSDSLGFECDRTEVLYERGIAYYLMDSLKLAYYDFVYCLNNNYERGTNLCWRGLIYYRRGLKEKACADWYEAGLLGNKDAIAYYGKYCK